ncbi:hypothetical protein D9M72_579560 [compost metagenome]
MRRGNAGAQVAVGGVLGRHAEATPPVHAVLFGGIIYPGLADIGSAGLEAVVAQRTNEVDRAVGVIVRREILEIAQILGDFAIGFLDALIAPDRRLDRRAKANANSLADETGIDLFVNRFFAELGHHASFVIHQNVRAARKLARLSAAA